MIEIFADNKKMKKKYKIKTENKREIMETEKVDTTKKINYLYHISLVFLNYIYKIITLGLGIFGIYLIWILLHYFASHLYVKLCVPNTMYGFIISPFLVSTPYCTGLRWLIYTGANTIHNMWILFGSWISSRVIILTNP